MFECGTIYYHNIGSNSMYGSYSIICVPFITNYSYACHSDLNFKILSWNIFQHLYFISITVIHGLLMPVMQVSSPQRLSRTALAINIVAVLPNPFTDETWINTKQLYQHHQMDWNPVISFIHNRCIQSCPLVD